MRWSASAKADVEKILKHLAVYLDNSKAASDHLDAFLDAANRISEFPEMRAVGAQPSLACRNLRPNFVKNYVMLYLLEDGDVVVYRVFHTLQDYARLIRRESI